MTPRKGEQDRINAAAPLHNRIAVLRAERGLSRQDLAAAVEVNYQTIGYLERGDYNPSLELAFRLSEVFGLPIEAIFSREPFRPLSLEVYGRRGREPSQEGGHG
jgi:putative transcriptional regulator